MADISKLIEPKSDQLNADDLSAGDRIIRISEVRVLGAGREQPIHIHFEGDNGKPWKPCKTMARLLASLWNSPDTSTWVGRSVKIYRDPDVLWAGAKIGGIRVRAVSHIDAPRQVAITESKTKRKLARIDVLTAEVRDLPQTKRQTAEEWTASHIAEVQSAADTDALADLMAKGAKPMAKLQGEKPELWAEVNAAYAARRAQIEAPGKAVEDAGEGFTTDEEWGE